MRYRDIFLVDPEKPLSLNDVDPSFKGDHLSHESAASESERHRQELTKLQPLLYAQGKWSLLIVLQAMDAGGKDGTISHVLSGVNPQGTRVESFKAPAGDELAHDFLWRIHQRAPKKGEIAIFNRSHYEDAVVPLVHHKIEKDEWKKRLRHIRAFEDNLIDNGTVIVKFFLHISKEEQLARFEARLDEPEKNWKIDEADYDERAYWGDYLRIYRDTIAETSTKRAPWFVIPANHKWFRNLAVSEILVDILKDLQMTYPKPKVDLAEIRRRHHAAVKEEAAAANKKKKTDS